jgi:hypothetical protein
MIMKREDAQALTHNMITHPRVLRDVLGDLQDTREEADDLDDRHEEKAFKILIELSELRLQAAIDAFWDAADLIELFPPIDHGARDHEHADQERRRGGWTRWSGSGTGLIT